MPVSAILSNAGLTPNFELPGKDTQAGKQQKAVFLPGKNSKSSFEKPLPNREVDVADYVLALNRRLQFVVDQRSNEVTVKVIDNRTEEVVRILPPEELQRLNGDHDDGKGVLLSRMA